MTKTLGVIGNSHLAAMKLGWERLKNGFPRTELIFFGTPRRHVEQLKVSQCSLVPTSDEAARKFDRFSGRSKISGAYDEFVVCDLGIRVWLALRLYHGLMPIVTP